MQSNISIIVTCW